MEILTDTILYLSEHHTRDTGTIVIGEAINVTVVNDVSETTLTFSLQKNSTLQYIDIGKEGSIQASILTVHLDGEGAEVRVRGLFFGANKEKSLVSHSVHHRASHTTSDILVRGVLKDAALASYSGLIQIAPGAAGCRGRQDEHTLLLSRDAHVDTVPKLEISNNDVQCSHSAATTYIDEVKKFYLASRGLNDTKASEAIIQGHLQPIVACLPEKMRQQFERIMVSV